MVPIVVCIKNNRPEEWDFTVGKTYNITKKGFIDDRGYRFTMFLSGYKNSTPVEAWLKWSKTPFLEFVLVKKGIRRF